MNSPFPPLYDYAMAHHCTSCGAQAGVECEAPRKRTSDEPAHRLHKARQQAGIRHKARDIGNAPWPEDREPGRRYDSLGGDAA